MLTQEVSSLPRNGLVLEALLNGVVADTNDGSKATLSATSVSWGDSPVSYQKQRGVFNGSTSRVYTTNNPTLNTEWEFSLDFKVNSLSSSFVLFDRDNTSTQRVFSLQYYSVDNKLHLYCWNDYQDFYDCATSAGVLQAGVEYHISCRWDNTLNKVKIILNNVEVASVDKSRNCRDSTVSFTIGAQNNGSNYFTNGYIGGVRLFNRVLSDLERQAYWLEFNRQLAGGTDFGVVIRPPVFASISPKFDEYASLLPTVNGSPTDTTDLFGISSGAQAYDGNTANHYYGSGFSIASGSSRTFIALVNGNSAPANVSPGPSYEYATALGNSTGGSGSMGFQWNYTTGYPSRIGAAFVNPSGTPYYAQFGSLSGSTWYVLGAVFNQTGNTLRTYTDGTFNNQVATSGTLGAISDFRFGGNGAGLTGFPGKIGQWMVFDYALTDAQISYVTQCMRSGRYPYAFRNSLPLSIQKKLYAWFPCDVSGSSSPDYGPNGFTMTKNGTVNAIRALQSKAMNVAGAGYLSNGTFLDTGLSTFTFCGWFRFTSSSRMFPVDKTSSTTNYPFEFAVNDSATGDLRLISGTASAQNIYYSGGGLNDGKWHHIAIYKDSTSQGVVVDGSIRVSSGSLGTMPNDTTYDFHIGQRSDGSSKYTGDVGDVMFFDSKLSLDEINAIRYSTFRF